MDPASVIAQQAPPLSPEPPSKAPDYSNDNPVEFAAPKDFIPPDSVKPGEVFQALGTFRMKDDSTMCLVAVDGSQVTAPETKAPEKKPETMPEALKKELPATGMPA